MLQKIKGNLNLLNSFIRSKWSSKSQNECSMHERFCVCQGFTFLVFFRAQKFSYNTVEIQVVLHNDNFLHIINVFFYLFIIFFQLFFLNFFVCFSFCVCLFPIQQYLNLFLLMRIGYIDITTNISIISVNYFFSAIQYHLCSRYRRRHK